MPDSLLNPESIDPNGAVREATDQAVRSAGARAGLPASAMCMISADSAELPDRAAFVIIVEIGTATPDRLARVEEIVATARTGATIVAIVDAPAGDDVRRLFRAGVSDVLSYPINSEELLAALETAKRNAAVASPEPGRSGRLISVLKAGGGVGSTTVAANLARELAHRGAGRVALIDMDVQFGGVAVCLDLDAPLSLSDAIRAGSRLDETMLKSMMSHHKSGFDVLPSAKSLAPVDVITEEFVDAFCRQLKLTYDVAIFDMPTSWAPWFSPALDASDLIIPVVEPTVRSADCARRIAQSIEDLGVESPRLLPIANKTSREPAARDRAKAIGDILHTKIDLTLREDAKSAQQAADLGQCLRDVAAGSGLVQDYEQVASAVISICGLNASSFPESGSKSRRLSIFGARP